MNPTQEQIVSLLNQTQFAAGLSPQILRSLAGTASVITATPGTVLFEEGSRQNTIFIVISGHVAVEMQVPRRGSVRLLTVGPGELVGWSGLIGDGVMSATAKATEDTTLVALSSRRLLEVSSNDHEFGYLLMTRAARTISARLLATRLQLLDLFSESEPIPQSPSVA